VVITPATPHRNGNLVGILPLEIPVIDPGNLLDDINGMDGAVSFDLE
jgi:hypothetical protein